MSYSRADRKGAHRANYERNRKRIIATQNTCGICGHPVDFSLKSPHPMSATADHIIPIAKNGHPSDISNLQLAHWTCNRQKSDKIFKQEHQTKQVVSNRVLPQSLDWMSYSSDNKVVSESKTNSNQKENETKENKNNNKIKIINKKKVNIKDNIVYNKKNRINNSSKNNEVITDTNSNTTKRRSKIIVKRKIKP